MKPTLMTEDSKPTSRNSDDRRRRVRRVLALVVVFVLLQLFFAAATTLMMSMSMRAPVSSSVLQLVYFGLNLLNWYAAPILVLWLVMRSGETDFWTYVIPCSLLLLSAITNLVPFFTVNQGLSTTPYFWYLLVSGLAYIQLATFLFALHRILRLRLVPKNVNVFVASFSIRNIFAVMALLALTWVLQDIAFIQLKKLQGFGGSFGQYSVYTFAQAIGWIGCIGLVAKRNSRRYVSWVLLIAMIGFQIAMTTYYYWIEIPRMQAEARASGSTVQFGGFEIWSTLFSVFSTFVIMCSCLFAIRWAGYEWTECSALTRQPQGMDPSEHPLEAVPN